jgi:hypothetical protein
MLGGHVCCETAETVIVKQDSGLDHFGIRRDLK